MTYPFLPIFVIIYKKNLKAFVILSLVIVFLGIGSNTLAIFRVYQHSVRPISSNHLFYSRFLVKPFSKLTPLGMALLT